MTTLKKTNIVAVIVGIISAFFGGYVQYRGQSNVKNACSYLDPILIDILAFIAALFLIIEGFCRIWENRNVTFKRHITRIIRIGFGCSILTLHVMQFMHK